MTAVVQQWTSTQARNAAMAIVRTLRGKGHTAYFAGGCVRDALLGAEPVDFDIATSARPEQVQTLFRQTAAVGASFGVVLVREQGVTVEVATFRSDGPYSDKRRPDRVEFADAEHDAQRRDFTINALFLDPLVGGPALRAGRGGSAFQTEEDVGDGSERHGSASGATKTHGSESRATGNDVPGIIDFVGGLDDLRAGLIRAVGDPEQRLAEDHLRALRAVRFAARYRFEIEPTTAAAIGAHATDLAGVSCERIGEEFRRMMDHPSRARAVGLLKKLGLDGVLLGEGGGGAGDEGSVLAALQSPGLQAGGMSEKHRGAQTDPLPTEVGGSEGGGASEGRVSFASCLAAIAFDRAEVGSPAMIPALVRRWRKSLCLTNDESTRLRDVLFGVTEMATAWQNLPLSHRKRRAASLWFEEALAVTAARDPRLGSTIRADVEELAADGIGLAPPPLLDGTDLLGLGLEPGPVFALVLTAVYDAQLEGRVQQKADALALAAELGGSGGV